MTLKGRPHKERLCHLYLVTNTENGKSYVGVTTHTNIRRRLSEHFYVAEKRILQGAFQRAIRKYGRKCFKIVLRATFPNVDTAFEAEIAYIREHAPPYNSTLGGDGARGHLLSAEARAKISAAGKGGRRHVTPHSASTKKRLSDLGHANKEKFAKYAALGPKASSRPVLCTDTGEIFESASAAARNKGVSKSALIELCLGKNYRQTVGGFHFKYVEMN